MTMPKPTKRADGRWMLALPREDGRRRYVYGKTPEEALDKYHQATGQGIYQVRKGSINEFYVTHYGPWISTRVQKASLRRYDNVYQHVGTRIGDYLFSELTARDVQEAVTGAGGASTQATAKGMLKQIVTLAIAHGWATEKQLAMVMLAKHKPVKARKRRNVVARATAMLEAIRTAGHWVEGPVWAAMTLGLRKGELCGLRITDLGDDNVLTVRHQRDHRTGDRERLKHREEGEARRIALPPAVADQLRAYASTGSIYFFTDDKGRPIQYQHMDRAVTPFQPDEPLTIHDLRSAAVSRLHELGVPKETIKDIVGHMSADMTEQYMDLSDERIAEALSRTPSRTTSSDNQGR